MNSPSLQEPEQDNSNELSLRDYWDTVIRYRINFILIVIIAVITSASLQIFSPKKYTASSKLLSLIVDNDADSIYRAFGKASSSTLDPGTISRIALSKKVLPNALKLTMANFEVYKEESQLSAEELYLAKTFDSDYLKSIISIRPDSNAVDILTISATLNDAPHLCAAAVNGLSEALLDTLTENHRKTLKLEISNLNNSIIKNEEEIKLLENRLRELQNKESSLNISLDERRLTQKIDLLDSQLSATDLNKKEIQDQIYMIKVDFGIQEIPFESVRWVDISSTMNQKLQNLKFEREELLTRYLPENPSIKKLDNQINSLEETLRPSSNQQNLHYVEVDRFKTGIVSRLLQLLAEASALEKRTAHIKSEMLAIQEQIFNAPEEQKQIIALRNKKKILEQLQLNLHTTLQTSKIQLLSLNSNFELLERAVPPRSTSSAGLARYIVIGIAFGVALAFFVVFILKNWENTLKSSMDLKRHFKHPSLGSLPKWKAEELFIDEMHPDSQIAEVYGVLRNHIRFSSHNLPEKSLLVASAHQGEGKSITAANLAISFALEGNSVLLISADLRRPESQSIFLDKDQDIGIVEYLEGGAELEDVIHPSEITNLSVVPTIHRANNPTKLLKHPRFKKLLDFGEENFDVMIIDSPAILPVVDSTMFANLVRGVLLIAQADHTPINSIQEAINRLEHVQAPIIGISLNKISDLRLEYFYNYGNNQYYGYQST